jgi:hypothetical protein
LLLEPAGIAEVEKDIALASSAVIAGRFPLAMVSIVWYALANCH